MANQYAGKSSYQKTGDSSYENLGGGWAKKTPKGTMITLSIKIDGVPHKLFLFENKEKKGEKSPDFRVTRSSADWVAKNATKSSPATAAPVDTAPAAASAKAPWEK